MIVLRAVLIKYMLLLNEFSLINTVVANCLEICIPIQYIVVPAETIGGVGIWKGRKGYPAG